MLFKRHIIEIHCQNNEKYKHPPVIKFRNSEGLYGTELAD